MKPTAKQDTRKPTREQQLAAQLKAVGWEIVRGGKWPRTIRKAA